MADVSKVFGGSITAIFVSEDGGATQIDLGLVGDGNFTLKIDPVKRKNSGHEDVVVAYDVSFEAELLEVKNLSAITPHNNQIRTILLNQQGETAQIKIMPLRLNVGVEMDFGDTSKGGIKITAAQRIAPSEVDDVIDFAYSNPS